MKKFGKLKSLLLSATLTCVSAFSYEFWQSENPIKWAKDTLEFKVDPTLGEEGRQAFIDSAAKWSNALDGKIKFVESDNSKYDIFMSKEVLNDKKNAQAVWSDDGKGNFKYCRIGLNSKKLFSRNIEDNDRDVLYLDSIVMHELGHALGLKDLYSKDAEKITDPYILYYDTPTMFNEYSMKGTHSILHLDDIRGIRRLYGLSDPVSESVPFTISKIAGKRRKDISEFKILRRGVYEFISSVGEQLTVFKLNGTVFSGNPIKYTLPRGYYFVIAEYRGRVTSESFLIGKVQKVKTSASMRENE